MTEETKKNYEKYRWYLKSYIKRDGIDNLIKFLDTQTDMAVAPASARYHLCCEGGLVKHSINVMMRLHKLMKMEYGDDIPYSNETLALVSLLHDISKINFYQLSTKNVKDKDGNWVQQPYYSIREDKLIYGSHEQNSLMIVSHFLKLSFEEELAILYHHGGFNACDDGARARVQRAFSASSLALFLSMADEMASCIDEDKQELADPKMYTLAEEDNTNEENANLE